MFSLSQDWSLYITCFLRYIYRYMNIFNIWERQCSVGDQKVILKSYKMHLRNKSSIVTFSQPNPGNKSLADLKILLLSWASILHILNNQKVIKYDQLPPCTSTLWSVWSVNCKSFKFGHKILSSCFIQLLSIFL